MSSLLKLPVDLLEELFDREELQCADFKNLRLTTANPTLNESLSSRLFSTFTLDLDSPSCLELLVGFHPELTKPIKDNVGDDGMIDVTDINSDDEASGEEEKPQPIQAPGEEEKKRKAVDFTQIGPHVRDLHIVGTKSMASSYPVSRSKLLATGLSPFLSQLPNLLSVHASLTDRALITTDWAKLLQSICPAETDNWELHLRVDRRMDNADDDEIYRNAHHLRNLTTLAATLQLRFGDENREEHSSSAINGIASAVANSPKLTSLTFGLGYSVDCESDSLFDAIPGNAPLPLQSLTLDNAYGPSNRTNVLRLMNLRSLSLREPLPHRPLPYDYPDTEPAEPSRHDDCASAGCVFTRLREANILLSSISTYEVCDGFISYISNPSLTGVLTSITLKGVSGTDASVADEYASQFWSSITPHAAHIRELHVDPSYYGAYCYSPSSPASTILPKMTSLRELSLVPASESGPHVDSFIESLWCHKSLSTIRFNLASYNGERGAWCGTNMVMHSESMREAYKNSLEKDCKGKEGKPGFERVVMRGGWYIGRGQPKDLVWVGRKDGKDGLWGLVRTGGDWRGDNYGED